MVVWLVRDRAELTFSSAQAIESTNLIPLHSDLVHLIRAAEDVNSVDDAIVRNLDIVLVATMTILYKLHQQLKESPFGGDASRQQRMQEYRAKARSLMTFAGMVGGCLSFWWWVLFADFVLATQLRYRLSSDTYSQLTRLDVFIN